MKLRRPGKPIAGLSVGSADSSGTMAAMKQQHNRYHREQARQRSSAPIEPLKRRYSETKIESHLDAAARRIDGDELPIPIK